MDSIPLLKVSFRFSAGVTFMTWKLPTGWCVTSITGCSCMQAKGHCWIRVQQQVFHVTSCCAGGLGARSGCRRAQMSLKGSPAVAVISLSCPLEPLHFLSTFYCFSHHLIKCVKGPGCPYPPAHGGAQMAEPCTSPGQRFSLISCMTLGGHDIKDHQILPANHIVMSVKCFSPQPFGLTECMGLLFKS